MTRQSDANIISTMGISLTIIDRAVDSTLAKFIISKLFKNTKKILFKLKSLFSLILFIIIINIFFCTDLN